MRTIRTLVASAAAIGLLLLTAPMLPALAQKAPAADAARVASAKEMMAAAGVSKQFDAIMPLIFNQMQGIFLQQHPKQQRELTEVFDAVVVRMSALKQ